MTTLTKVLIGAAVMTVSTVVIAAVASKEEDDIQEVPVTNSNGEAKVVVMPKRSILSKIKSYVTKKVVKILAWVALHKEQIESAGAILGLAGTVISITGAVRDFVRSNDLAGKLDDVSKKLDDLSNTMNENHVLYSGEFHAIYEDHKILAKNQLKIAKKVGINVE